MDREEQLIFFLTFLWQFCAFQIFQVFQASIPNYAVCMYGRIEKERDE